METKVSKWGNSYAVRIPKHIADELRWDENDTVKLESTKKGLLIKRPSKEQVLADMLKEIRPQQEMDWGAARGKEAW